VVGRSAGRWNMHMRIYMATAAANPRRLAIAIFWGWRVRLAPGKAKCGPQLASIVGAVHFNRLPR